jgi:hypothetical protein
MIERFQSLRKEPSKTLVGMIAAFLKIEKEQTKIIDNYYIKNGNKRRVFSR